MPRDIGILIDCDDLADGLDDGVVFDAQSIESLGGQAVFFLYQPEQQVLGAHVGLVQGTGLILSQDEDLAGLVGDFLKAHACLNSRKFLVSA